MKHRVIIIEQKQNHSVDCKTYQRQKGYLTMRGLITDYSINIMNSKFNIETLKYYEKTGHFSYQDKYLKFDLNENIITENIHYGDVDGLLIGSRYSLYALSLQVMFGMDAAFNVTKYKELKLLTVVFLNGNGKIVLGCVGLLPGAESAGNINAFVDAMKNTIFLKVDPQGFENLQYIITDASQATHNSLEESLTMLK